MIKAKKGLLIALFAAMMVFAFGATSAFAAEGDIDWASDYKTATYTTSEGDVELAASWAFGSNGLTTATVKYNNAPVGNAYFYDFTNATINLGNNWTKQAYDDLPNVTPSIILAKPTGATGSDTATVESKTFGNWNAVYKVDKDIESGAAPVDVVLTRDSSWATEDEGTPENPAKFGNVTTKTVNVTASGATATWQEMVEGVATNVTNSDTLTPPYDGTQHTLFAKAVKNYTVSYQKYSATAGAWQSVDAVTYQDVDDPVQYRAVYTPTKVGEKYTYVPLTITVQPINPFNFNWTKANAKTSSGRPYYELTAEQAADPWAFVEFNNRLGEKKADVNIAEITTVVKEMWTIEVTKNAIDANQQTWTFKQKYAEADQAKAFKALKKANETLFANYRIGKYSDVYWAYNGTGMSAPGASVNVVITGAQLKDDSISMIAPNATYHVKKAKKLKKNKSFTVEAKATSGNTVTYEISKSQSKKITIDSATGKVTVKKGLKKGTYKVTVKAMTSEGNGYKACTESAQITIKVKK